MKLLLHSDENGDIKVAARATAGLLAAPKGMEEELRSGTWSTVRLARRNGRYVTVVFPDGSVRNE